jgi:hypothetical protein
MRCLTLDETRIASMLCKRYTPYEATRVPYQSGAPCSPPYLLISL